MWAVCHNRYDKFEFSPEHMWSSTDKILCLSGIGETNRWAAPRGCCTSVLAITQCLHNNWGTDRRHHIVCSTAQIILRITTWCKSPPGVMLGPCNSPRQHGDVVCHYVGHSWYTPGYIITMVADSLAANRPLQNHLYIHGNRHSMCWEILISPEHLYNRQHLHFDFSCMIYTVLNLFCGRWHWTKPLPQQATTFCQWTFYMRFEWKWKTFLLSKAISKCFLQYVPRCVKYVESSDIRHSYKKPDSCIKLQHCSITENWCEYSTTHDWYGEIHNFAIIKSIIHTWIRTYDLIFVIHPVMDTRWFLNIF